MFPGVSPFEGRVLGHEIAGTIESFGAKVDPAKLGLAVGDQVLVYPWIGCGNCSVCAVGSHHTCESDLGGGSSIGVGENAGGFSTHVRVPRCNYLVKLPSSIPPSTGCMLPCSGITALTAVKKVKPSLQHAVKKFGEARFLIAGAGGLGLWATKLSKILFKDLNVSVTVADVSQKSLDIAKEAGADETLLWDPKDDVPTSIAKTTDNGKRKMSAAIDFVGRDTTCGIALHSLRKEGHLVVVGLFGGALTTPIPGLVLTELKVQGSYTGSLETLRELVDMMSEQNISYPSQEIYTLDEINTALDKLKGGQIRGRAVLKM